MTTRTAPHAHDWIALLANARQAATVARQAVLDQLFNVMGPTGVDRDFRDHVLESTGVELLIEPTGTLDVLACLPPAAGQGTGLPAVHVRRDQGRQALLMADPWDDAAVQAACRSLGQYVEPVAARAELLKVLAQSSTVRAMHEDGWRDRVKQDLSSASLEPEGWPREVVAFVDACIGHAYRTGASDVHFECGRQGLRVKLRLDGVMSSLAGLPDPQSAEEVISRIKVLAQLDITERRLPQDGRFRFALAGGGLDLRVSIMPSVFGEDAVLRLLDKSHLRAQSEQVSLASLGFEQDQAGRIRQLSALPNGMLLVTGPTGSGKTTTIYAVLSETHTGQEKIITIEDPVEYELPGVLQIPVNERKGLSFARGLRSILRRDPDRILVGEIRDAETAEIAVQAALTGHLVFTTVHANSLFDVIGRFRHFGLDMFGFVSALNGVVVQRLMRRLCDHCASTRAVAPGERAWLTRQGYAELGQIPTAHGCEACHGTGYRGRFVVAEVHRIEDALRDKVMAQADVSELKRLAFAGNMPPLVQIALREMLAGRTTLEEIFRVVGQV